MKLVVRFFLMLLFFSVMTTSGHTQILQNIFKADRQGDLCIVDSGERIVGKLELARAIVDEVGVPYSLLARANSTGKVDNTVTAEEVVYTVVEDSPFASIPNSEENKRIQEVTGKLREVQGMLTDFLNSRGIPEEGYEVISNVPQGPVARDLFSQDTRVRIRCLTVSASTNHESKPPLTFPPLAMTLGDYFLIRGKVEELALPREKIRDADAAEISFRKNTKVPDIFQVDAVFGLDVTDIAPKIEGLRYIPYVRYQRTDVHPNTKKINDVHVVSPGFLLDYLYIGDSMSAEAGLYPTATLDREQDSEILKLKGFVAPSFSIGSERDSKVFLGGYLPLIGPLTVRPDLKLLAEMGHVFAKGSSTDIDDDDQYAGLGGEASLKFRFPMVPILTHFVPSVSYRDLRLISGKKHAIRRVTTMLTYAFPQNPNLVINFSYENGENEETFQDEEFWKLSLGVRY
jgi:hypothetical protein